MFDFDKWQEIFSIIEQNKLRTFLTALGVFWGIFMLIILLGAGNGLQTGFFHQFKGFASNSLFIWPSKTTKPYEGLQPGRRYAFSYEDVQHLRDQVPEADYISPRLPIGTGLVYYETKNGAFAVEGDHPDYFKISTPNIQTGRILNLADMQERRKVAFIGHRVAEVLFDEGQDPVGEYIRYNGNYFKVVGVFKSYQNNERASQAEQTIHIPLSTAQQIANTGDIIRYFAITAKPDKSAEVVEKKVRKILAERHKVHPEDRAAIGSFNIAKLFKTINLVFSGIQFFTWFVGIGSLIAGIIGISNIMLITVKERTREFGVRKALGATPGSIISLVIQESIVLTMIAGYLGILVGVFCVEGLNAVLEAFNANAEFFRNPTVPFSTIIVATLILVFSGLIAGLIPATHAANIKPIEALRAE